MPQCEPEFLMTHSSIHSLSVSSSVAVPSIIVLYSTQCVLFCTCFNTGLITLLFFLRSFPLLCFDNPRPFFSTQFPQKIMHMKLFTYFPLRTYNQHFTGKNKSLYLFTMQRSPVIFHLTEELKRSLKYMLLGLLSLSRQKASI